MKSKKILIDEADLDVLLSMVEALLIENFKAMQATREQVHECLPKIQRLSKKYNMPTLLGKKAKA